jgi:hypothetical protein
MNKHFWHLALTVSWALLGGAHCLSAQTSPTTDASADPIRKACVQIPDKDYLARGLNDAEGTCGDKDFEAAAQMFRRSCDGGNGQGCEQLGFLYYDGTGVPKDFAQTAKLYQAACEEGIYQACSNLGMLYRNGEGVAKSDQMALPFFQRSCAGNFAAGCYNLGLLYHHGEGVSKDEAKAAKIYQKGCDLGDTTACLNLGIFARQRERHPEGRSGSDCCAGKGLPGRRNTGLLWSRTRIWSRPRRTKRLWQGQALLVNGLRPRDGRSLLQRSYPL